MTVATMANLGKFSMPSKKYFCQIREEFWSSIGTVADISESDADAGSPSFRNDDSSVAREEGRAEAGAGAGAVESFTGTGGGFSLKEAKRAPTRQTRLTADTGMGEETGAVAGDRFWRRGTFSGCSACFCLLFFAGRDTPLGLKKRKRRAAEAEGRELPRPAEKCHG